MFFNVFKIYFLNFKVMKINFLNVWAGPFIQVKSGFISGWPTSLALFMVVFVLV